MPIQSESSWKRFIGKVSATLELYCLDREADDVSEILGVQPTEAGSLETRPTFTSQAITPARHGCFWRYETRHFSSTDVDEHVRDLLQVFMPLKSRLEEMRPTLICAYIYWETTIPGLSPLEVNSDCIQGLAELGARLRIQIVKIDKVDDD